MRRISLLFIFYLMAMLCIAQPKFEVRAAWITNIYGLDWPHTPANSLENRDKQKKELIAILDKLEELNINTVLFQARARGDVFYSSKYEPYSKVLTGKNNQNPGYDPLSFAIEECHKRGMECHAWIVSIPIGTEKQIKNLGSRSIPRKYPQLCFKYKHQYYLNPGLAGTKDYLSKLVNEIVDKYDVDGIHLDYLRYPEHLPSYVDRNSYRKYSKGKSLADWRRDNITTIMRHIYKGVKVRKPWVKVSTAPIGKFDDTSRFSSKGWNAYHTVYQDVQKWLREGIQDQIYPMVYFKDENFYPFTLDWLENDSGRQIIPGLGIYFLEVPEKKWTTDDIERQINFLRTHQFAGEGFYRTEFLIKNSKNLTEILQKHYYDYPALQPPMPWLDSIAPVLKGHLRIKQKGIYDWELEWDKATDNDSKNLPTYTIYASDKYPVDITNPHNILITQLKDNHFTYAPLLSWMHHYYFAVTAIDRYGNESSPIQAEIQ